MRAKDLLAILPLSPFQEEYQGIYLQQEEQLVPFTNFEEDSHGNLVFFIQPQSSPLLIKDLLIKLMTNKASPILYWDGHERKPVFGIKEEQTKIIL